MVQVLKPFFQVSTININNISSFREFINSKKYFKDIYVREIYNFGINEKKDESNGSFLLFLLKTQLFLAWHFILSLLPKPKNKFEKYIFCSPDYHYNSKSGYHNYWSEIDKHFNLNEVSFVYFNEINLRVGFGKKKRSIAIDRYFSISSYYKLQKQVFKYVFLSAYLFLKSKFTKGFKAPFLKKILNLGTFNDYYVFYLMEVISKHNSFNSSKIILASEFQYWELGLFKNYSKDYFSYQHSGIRYKDPRIKYFIKKNSNLKVIVSNIQEKKYLQKKGFENVFFAESLKNLEPLSSNTESALTQVFFGSLRVNTDKKVINALGNDLHYKTHPAISESLFKGIKYWRLNDGAIYPIVYATSWLANCLLYNKSPGRIIYNESHEMTLISVKNLLNKLEYKSQKLIDDLSYVDIEYEDYDDSFQSNTIKSFWNEI